MQPARRGPSPQGRLQRHGLLPGRPIPVSLHSCSSPRDSSWVQAPHLRPFRSAQQTQTAELLKAGVLQRGQIVFSCSPALPGGVKPLGKCCTSAQAHAEPAPVAWACFAQLLPLPPQEGRGPEVPFSSHAQPDLRRGTAPR